MPDTTEQPLSILVAGSSGFIGTPLVRALREAGHHVTTLVRREARTATEFRWAPGRRPLDPAILDGADAFVHPDAMAAVAASNKRAERAALDEVAEIVAAAVRRWDADGTNDQGLFGRIVEAWSSEAPDIRLRGIAFDVALIHIASMSNLAAALGWGLVDLLEHPAHLARVVAGVRVGEAAVAAVAAVFSRCVSASPASRTRAASPAHARERSLHRPGRFGPR